MKKSMILMASLALLAGMSSCSTDQDPKYKAPTVFVLNEPVLGNEYFQLVEGETFELVASQPDYGYSAITQYSAEVSLTPDFSEFKTIVPFEAPTVARMVFADADLAVAICQLMGYTKDDEGVVPPETAVYFRAVAELEKVKDSRIVSNVVKFERIKPYFAIPMPGYIYLVGNPEGWAGPTASNAAHYADWRLFEDDNAIGSKVYLGEFDLPASPMFRFYTKLTGWDADSYGYQVADEATNFDWAGVGDFRETVIKGKGAYGFSNYGGGKVKIMVDMSESDNYYFTMTEI